MSRLNEDNCLELLTAEDWNLLLEVDEEHHRRGAHFTRIFPPEQEEEEEEEEKQQQHEAYLKLFEVNRFSNRLIQQWMKLDKNLLEIVA